MRLHIRKILRHLQRNVILNPMQNGIFGILLKDANRPTILATGLKTSVSGYFAIRRRNSVYLTPSIEYAPHPPYVLPWQKN